MSGIGYRPEIDGLRAVAVIPVILFHMGISKIPGGFIGVDVFFVISGFLITSIIKKELEEGTFSFSNFWARRVRRILPAMVFVTACTLAVTYFFVFLPDQQDIGKQALSALFSVANIYFWRSAGDYWGSAAEESPFLHAWSLSVEEQFYLFFPIAMWLIFLIRSRWLQGCIATAAIVSLAMFLWGSHAHPTATFYLLPTRVWELGAGCLLAVSLSRQLSRDGNYGIFAVVGLGMVTLSYLFFDTLTGGLGLAVIGTTLIIAFGQSGLCNLFLSQRPVVHVGKISYSLYLWHWPVLVLAEPLGLDWPGVSDKLLLVAAIYALSLGSYHFIEKPTRRRPGVVAPILVSGLVVAGMALWMALTPRTYNVADSGFVDPVSTFAKYNIHPVRSDMKSKFKEGGVITLRDTPVPELVMLGDSHAASCADAVNDVAEKNDISTAFYVMSGLDPFCKVPPVAEQRRVFKLPPALQLEVDEAMLKHLAEWQPKVVLISCRWEHVDKEQATELLQWLAERDIRVLLLEDPPFLDIPDKNAMEYALYSGIKYTGERQYWPIKNFATNEVAYSLARQFPNVEVIPIFDIYANGETALLFDDRECVYQDDDHLTHYGASLAVEPIEKAVLQATGRSDQDVNE